MSQSKRRRIDGVTGSISGLLLAISPKLLANEASDMGDGVFHQLMERVDDLKERLILLKTFAWLLM
jgi:hypothetical protein